MATEIQTSTATEIQKTNGFAELSPQRQEAHRTKIGVRARSILGQFWRDDDTPDVEQAIEIEGWADVLENCSHSEIRAAWAEYQKFGPRTKTKKLYKPDAGAIYHLILDSRPKPSPPEVKSEADRAPRVTPEQMAAIMEENGFYDPGEEFMDGVVKSVRPMPFQSANQTRENINAAKDVAEGVDS